MRTLLLTGPGMVLGVLAGIAALVGVALARGLIVRSELELPGY
ncbi:MAG TPA: hypothetical protein VGC53_11680 [Vicinamibacteria bacterium]|jgi:hypothetical protein